MYAEVIRAQWRVPPNVHAFTTTREGGVSAGPYSSFNLGAHVGDDAQTVVQNRARAVARFELPSEPVWLTQVHGDNIVCADRYIAGQDADGSYTATTRTVCAVMTADCLPLFLCDASATRVGLFHIGWRGLARGLVRKAARLFNGGGGASAWLGPAIGPGAFEVGGEVKTTIESALDCRSECFVPVAGDKWLANLYALTAGELGHEGVVCSFDDSLCTWSDPSRFYSHRRSSPCGRMASLVWME